MKNLDPFLNERAKKYALGDLSPAAEKAFEKELAENSEAKKAFVRQSVLAQKPPDERAAALRKTIAAGLAQRQPMAPPALDFGWRLRVFFQNPAGKWAVASLAAAALFGLFWLKSDSKSPDFNLLAAEKMIPARCLGVAGERQTARAALEKASDFYCQNRPQIDSLLAMKKASGAAFAEADYFLAHAFLKNGKAAEAAAAFSACLAHADRLEAASDLLKNCGPSLRFNQILARLAVEKDVEKAQNELQKLIAELPDGSSVKASAQAFLIEI